MTWKEKLQEASFRNVPFGVDTAELTGGRRTATHEFPGKDINFIEDIGRVTREFSIEAFLVGDNYQDARDLLLEAVEKKGEGELIHPYYGRLNVIVSGQVRVQESSRDGGYAKITITFSETEAPKYPAVVADTKASLLAQVSAAINSALAIFKKAFSIFQKAQGIVDGVSATINIAILAIQEAKSYGRRALDFQNAIQNLKNNTLALALEVNPLANIMMILLTGGEGLAEVLENLKLKDFGKDELITEPNKAALTSFVQQLAVIGAARAVAGVEFTNLDDAVKLRSQLSAALDELMASADEELYPDIWNLRCSVIADIDARAMNLPRVVEITLLAVQPVLCLAYDLYEDVDRAAEIVSKNINIIHPGMVPAGVPIEVLSRG